MPVDEPSPDETVQTFRDLSKLLAEPPPPYAQRDLREERATWEPEGDECPPPTK